MRKFIRRTLFFLSVLTGLIICLYLSISLIERNYSNFKLENNPKYIVVGHSHAECAYNDSLIPGLKNLSQSAESYFYTYFKLRQIIKQNPSIKVVFIEFSNNSIAERMNSWIWGNNYMANNYPKYFSFINGSGSLLLFRNNPSMYFNALSFSIKNGLYRICQKKLDFTSQIGGYSPLIRNMEDTANSQAAATVNGISENNLVYLDAIIKFCKDNDIDPILIRSPLHEKYRGYENETLYRQILEKRYANIEYMDFSKFPASNSGFGDLEHLNCKGAAVFSKWFGNLLQDGILDLKDKQAYIDEAIRKERMGQGLQFIDHRKFNYLELAM